MRNKLVFIAVSSILYGCGGGGEGESQTKITNNAAPVSAPAPAPALTTNNKSVDFGFQVQNKPSASKEVVIKNDGNAPLSLSSISLTGADNSMFAQSNDCGTSVAVGATCSVKLTFTPTSGGKKIASLTINSNSTGSPHNVNLSGAGAEYGDVEELAAVDACDLRTRRPNVQNGAYWFKPNSQEPAFKTYADFTLNDTTQLPKCWLQVRRIAGTGGWFPLNDGLLGNVELNPSFSHENNSSTHWSIKFETMFHEYKLLGNVRFLFMSGDRSTWCVLESRSGWMQPYNWGGPNANPNTWIVDSQNTGAKPGTMTNVLNRGEQNPAEPWIGCEGDFVANQNKMLYGEAGSTLYTTFKNAKDGINIYVQPVNNDSGGG